jgi:hypothetical protein
MENIKVFIENHRTEADCIAVTALWEGAEKVDRNHVYGMILSKTKRALAERLVRAIEAGVVISDLAIKTDVNGNTYVGSKSNVLGRTLNADLKRLGF